MFAENVKHYDRSCLEGEKDFTHQKHPGRKRGPSLDSCRRLAAGLQTGRTAESCGTAADGIRGADRRYPWIGSFDCGVVGGPGRPIAGGAVVARSTCGSVVHGLPGAIVESVWIFGAADRSSGGRGNAGGGDHAGISGIGRCGRGPGLDPEPGAWASHRGDWRVYGWGIGIVGAAANGIRCGGPGSGVSPDRASGRESDSHVVGTAGAGFDALAVGAVAAAVAYLGVGLGADPFDRAAGSAPVGRGGVARRAYDAGRVAGAVWGSG